MSSEFSNIFNQLLIERGVKPVDISKSTGISQGLLSDYKNGRSTPTSKNLTKLAEFFDVSVGFLLHSSDDTSNYKVANFTHSAVAQGPNATAVNGNTRLSKEESELFRIFNLLDVKGRHKILDLALKLEEDIQ